MNLLGSDARIAKDGNTLPCNAFIAQAGCTVSLVHTHSHHAPSLHTAPSHLAHQLRLLSANELAKRGRDLFGGSRVHERQAASRIRDSACELLAEHESVAVVNHVRREESAGGCLRQSVHRCVSLIPSAAKKSGRGADKRKRTTLTTAVSPAQRFSSFLPQDRVSGRESSRRAAEG